MWVGKCFECLGQEQQVERLLYETGLTAHYVGRNAIRLNLSAYSSSPSFPFVPDSISVVILFFLGLTFVLLNNYVFQLLMISFYL